MLAGGLRIEKNVEGECRLANQHFKTIYGRQAPRARGLRTLRDLWMRVKL